MGGLGRMALASLVATFASPAFAADWLKSVIDPPPGVEVHEEAVELGSGWYLRADAGAGFDDISKFGNKPSMSTWSVDFAAGYKFNNWFRMDLGLDLRKPQSSFATTQTLNGAQIICPSPGAQGGLQVLTDAKTGNPLGYIWDTILGTCHQDKASEMRAMSLLVNGYVDLGTWSGFTPYVGAGVGVTRLTSNSTVNYYNNADGSLFSPTTGQWSETPGVPLGWVDRFGNTVNPVNPNNNLQVSVASPPKWNQRSSSTRYNFAWALMAGVAYNLTDRAKLDIGFRYLNMGSFQAYAGGPSSTLSAKEVKVGLRYQID